MSVNKRAELGPYTGTLFDVSQGMEVVNNALIRAAKREGVDVQFAGRHVLMGFTPGELSGAAVRESSRTRRALGAAVPREAKPMLEDALF